MLKEKHWYRRKRNKNDKSKSKREMKIQRRNFSMISRQLLWQRLEEEDRKETSRLQMEIQKETKHLAEIDQTLKKLDTRETAALKLMIERNECQNRRETSQRILKIIQDSQIHINTLKKLYRMEKEKEQQSHLDNLLESSEDENTRDKILRDTPVVIITMESDTEPREDAAATTG